MDYTSKTLIMDNRLVTFPDKKSNQNHADFLLLRGAAKEPTGIVFYTSQYAVVGRCEVVTKGHFALYSALESNPTGLLSIAPRHLLNTTYRLFYESEAIYTFRRKRGEQIASVFEGKSTKDKSALKFVIVWNEDDMAVKVCSPQGEVGQPIAKWYENGFAQLSIGTDILFILACFVLGDFFKGGFNMEASKDDKLKVSQAIQPVLVRELASG